MSRSPLPPRRPSMTLHLKCPLNGSETEFGVTFGFDLTTGLVREVFCSPFKTGTDMQAMLRQVSIVLSVLHQHGVPMSELARILGEDEQDQPARSIVGAIVRVGAHLDREVSA